MDSISYLLILASVVLMSALIQSIFGFGFSLLIMTILPAFMPLSMAIIFNVSLAMINNLMMLTIYWKKVALKELLPFMIPTLIVCGFTAVWSLGINTDVMYFLLGCMLFILAVYFFIFSERIKIKATVKNGICMGVLCGFLGGLFSLCGPPAALYLMPALDDKDRFTATMQVFFLGLNFVNLGTRAAMGVVEVIYMPYLVVCIIVLIVGTLLGLKLRKNINGDGFKKAVYALVGINGIWVIISNFDKVF